MKSVISSEKMRLRTVLWCSASSRHDGAGRVERGDRVRDPALRQGSQPAGGAGVAGVPGAGGVL